MNWIVLPVRNGVEMTKAAIASMLAQDVGGIRIWLADNTERIPVGSTGAIRQLTIDVRKEFCERPDGSHDPRIADFGFSEGSSVSQLWNGALSSLFAYVSRNWLGERTGPLIDRILVCNNDIEIHPSTYRLLLADGGDFVTPVGTLDRPSVMEAEESSFRPWDKRPHPDFSCFMISRKTWETVGPFDERYEVAYCEDGDYHCRMHLAGIDAHSIGVPFYHRVNGTITNASSEEQAKTHAAANLNRQRFRAKWGFGQGDSDYYRFFAKSPDQLRAEGYSKDGINSFDPIMMGA